MYLMRFENIDRLFQGCVITKAPHLSLLLDTIAN